MATTYSPTLTNLNSCVAYYDPGNTRSYSGTGNNISSLLGNTSNISIIPAPTFSTDNGGVFVLGGTSAGDTTITGTYPRNFPTNNSFAHTLETVISPSGVPVFDQAILGFGTTAANSHLLTRDLADQLTVRSNGNPVIYYTMTTSNWYHIISVFNGTTITLYVNGVRVNSITTSPTVSIKGLYLFGYTGYDDFIGKASIVRVYNTALTQEEVFATFTSIRGRYGI